MKILHINSYYSGSRFYKNLYDKQIENGLKVATYVPVPMGMDVQPMRLGDYTTVSENHNKYDRLFFHIKHRKIYKDIITRYEINSFDIMHAHSLFSNGYIALKIKQTYGTPYVVAVRNTDVNNFFKYMLHLRKLGITILKEAKKIIFLSKPYRDLVIEKYIPAKFKNEIFDKAEVIPNGIDDFWIKNKACSKVSPEQEALKLVYVGTIDRNKNLTTTVKAIEQLKQKGCNVKFTVVGRIDDERVYKQIAEKSYVKYITPKTKEELMEIYRANDIFVMASVTETFGLVYAEAMSQGLPIIYSKGQGFDEQFDEGEVGYHVDCFNAEQIAARIVEIVELYDDISKRCINFVDGFDWFLLAQNYKRIYEEVIHYT